MNMAEFRKKIVRKGKFAEYVVYPYFSDENASHGALIIVSDQVEKPAELRHRRRKMADILPHGTGFEENIEIIEKSVGVVAPVYSVFDLKGNKLFQFRRNGE